MIRPRSSVSLLSLSILAALALTLGGCPGKRTLELDLDGEKTEDGLVPIQGARAAQAWGRPGVDISQYEKIRLAQVGVEARDVRRPPRSTSHTSATREYPLSESDVIQLAETVESIFHEELAQSEKFTLVEDNGHWPHQTSAVDVNRHLSELWKAAHG